MCAYARSNKTDFNRFGKVQLRRIAAFRRPHTNFIATTVHTGCVFNCDAETSVFFSHFSLDSFVCLFDMLSSVVSCLVLHCFFFIFFDFFFVISSVCLEFSLLLLCHFLDKQTLLLLLIEIHMLFYCHNRALCLIVSEHADHQMRTNIFTKLLCSLSLSVRVRYTERSPSFTFISHRMLSIEFRVWVESKQVFESLGESESDTKKSRDRERYDKVAWPSIQISKNSGHTIQQQKIHCRRNNEQKTELKETNIKINRKNHKKKSVFIRHLVFLSRFLKVLNGKKEMREKKSRNCATKSQ